jgi:hypothetical protein
MKTDDTNTKSATGADLLGRIVRILECCPKCKGEGELQCVHADLFRRFVCNGSGKNPWLRVGKVWGIGFACEAYREQQNCGGERNVMACKTYLGPFLVNFRVPLGKLFYPNKQISSQGEMPKSGK